MAYEKEIKTTLKNKYHANLGLSESSYEKVANILGATTDIKEEDIETLVNGAEPWLKIAQGEADIVRKNNKKPDPKPTPGGDSKPKEEDVHTELEKAIAKAVNPLLEKINTLEQGHIQKTNNEILLNLLKEKEIDPSYYAPAIEGRSFQNQDEITTFVEKLSTGYEAFNQSLADKGLLDVPKPVLGGQNKEGVSTAVQSYIEDKAKGPESVLGGKQV